MKETKSIFDRVLLYFVALVVTVLLGLMIRQEFSKPPIAFVDIGRLVDGYKFKKELEAVSGKNLGKIKYVIDSLQMVQRATGGNAQLDQQVSRAQNAMEEYYQQSNYEITKKIWDRLNPLMEQYGREKELELIIGANGAGTVLYGSKGRDITDDLLAYINQKYEKGS